MDETLRGLIREVSSQLPRQLLDALETLAKAFEIMAKEKAPDPRLRNELLTAAALLIEETVQRSTLDPLTAQRLADNIRRAGLQEAGAPKAALLEVAERVATGRPADGPRLGVHTQRERGFRFMVMRERGNELPTGRVAVFDEKGRMRAFENFPIGDRAGTRERARSLARRLKIPAHVITGILGAAFMLFFAAEIVGSVKKLKDPHTSLALMDKFAGVIAARDPSNPVVEIQELLAAIYEQTEKLGPAAAGFLYFIRADVMNELETLLEEVPAAARAQVARQIREYVQRMRRELAGGGAGAAPPKAPPPPGPATPRPPQPPQRPAAPPAPPPRSAGDIRQEIERLQRAIEETARRSEEAERRLRWLRAVERRQPSPDRERAITDQEAERRRLDELIAEWERRIRELGGDPAAGPSPEPGEPDIVDRELETTRRLIDDLDGRLRRYRERLPQAGEAESEGLRDLIQRLEKEREELRRFAEDLGGEGAGEPSQPPPLPPWPMGHDWARPRRLLVDPRTGEQRWSSKPMEGWEEMFGKDLEPRFRWGRRRRQDGAGWEDGWIPIPPSTGVHWPSGNWGDRWKFYARLYTEALRRAQARGAVVDPLVFYHGVDWYKPAWTLLAQAGPSLPGLVLRLQAALKGADLQAAAQRGQRGSGGTLRREEVLPLG